MKACALLVLTCLAAPARAADVHGTFSAVLAASEEPRGGTAVGNFPILGLASVDASQLGLPGTDESRVVLQGWGRLQLGDEVLHDNSADLGLLFLEARRGPVSLRLGRQHVVQGAARMSMIDGLAAEVRTDLGLYAQAFAGFNVHRELRIETGDWQGGGRVAMRLGLPGEVGLSYSQTRRDGDFARDDVGVDAIYLAGPVRLMGMAALSPEAARFLEGRLAATVAVQPTLWLTVDAARVAPDLFIPRTSIFSVFAVEKHDAFGGDLLWQLSPYYDVKLEGHALVLNGDGLGYRATVRAATYREPAHRSLVGIEGRRVDESANGYWRGRLFTGLSFTSDLRVTADAFAYFYDEPVNRFAVGGGKRESFLGDASVVYDLTRSMRVIGSVAGGKTPFAKSELQALVRFAYGYETDFAREWMP